MNKTQNRQFDPNVLAVLHRTGRVWRGVIARMPGSGGGKPRILAHREFSSAETTRIDAWLDQNEAGRVVSVLHASSVICRTCPLPDAPPDQLLPALRLQAEAHLFGIAPQHRMGMAVLEAAPGETTRSGIILAWPETSVARDAERAPTERDLLFAPDVAALACLLDGLRPAQPLAWIDREDGSMALAVAHANGAVFRGLREDTSDSEAWKSAAGRIIAETCLSVGHTGSFVDAQVAAMSDRIASMSVGEAGLLVPNEVIERARERIEHAPSDQAWWTAYGVAAGIVLARASELAALTQLRESVPLDTPTPLVRITRALSTQKAAVAAVVACVFVLMFGSLIVNGARLRLLQANHPESDRFAELRRVNEIRNQLVIYQELDRNSWSMTKILSDIASNTPEGIELEFIRITPMRAFNLRGRAIPHGGRSATEVVGLMRQYLNESGIFYDAALNWGEGDAFGNYQFDLSAKLLRPYRQYDYPDELDFAEWTLADRRQGRRPDTASEAPSAAAGSAVVDEVISEIGGLLAGDAVETDYADDDDAMYADDAEYVDADYDVALGDEDRDDGGRVVRAPTRDPGRLGPSRPDAPRGGREAASPGDRGDGSVSSVAADIPPPMTREQIERMTVEEVRDMLAKVAQARQYARTRNDAELTERLRNEFQWLMDRMSSLNP